MGIVGNVSVVYLTNKIIRYRVRIINLIATRTGFLKKNSGGGLNLVVL